MGILLPFVVAPAAVALIFGNLFGDRYGLINERARPGRHRRRSPGTSTRLASHVAIASMVNWRWTGYNALILLAAMQAVPRDLYESAALDGAGRVRQFRYVTIPMIRPTLIFVIITSTIGGLQIFTEARLFDNVGLRRLRPPVADRDALPLGARLAAAQPGPGLRGRVAAVPVHRRWSPCSTSCSAAASAAGGRA